MKNVELKQRLHHFIETGSEKKLKAIYVMVESEIEEAYDRWNDPEFVDKIQRRTKEMETGSVKTYSWNEVQEKAVAALNEARKK